MTDRSPAETSPQPSRRDFLKASTASVAAGAVAANLGITSAAHAAGSDVLRVGLIGCGGRGTGAASQALNADKNTQLVAMADVFEDHLQTRLKSLQARHGDQVQVDKEHQFVGFDAYKDVIAASDVVLLATPPQFRPAQLKAAVEAGKHVFCEKPVAVDAPGIRSVLETAELAKKKNLSLVSGLCWRYHHAIKATFEQIHQERAIGDITALQCSYNSNGVWEPRRKREECANDMEYQMRNWYYYTWLSGDFNVEQHVHSLDKIAWAMNDETPVKVSGSGGRIQRTDPKYGNIYDHFSIVYEYESGVKAFARCQHFRGCNLDVTDHFFGTKGTCHIAAHRPAITGENRWRYQGPKCDMYQVEHDELFKSIRSGEPINNGYYMSMSSMLAIAGRMAAYTGKTLSWEECMNSTLNLTPSSYEWGPRETPQVSIPGVTKFV